MALYPLEFKKLTKEERRLAAHAKEGHIIYDPKCKACVQGLGKERKHLWGTPTVETIYCDMAGPLQKARGCDPESQTYLVVFAVRVRVNTEEKRILIEY